VGNIVEVNEQGVLTLPPEVLPQVSPHKRFVLEVQGDVLVLRPERAEAFWVSASPERRAAAFRDWAAGHEEGPGLPDEALRRENLYD
jgi:hypothetical protein